VSDLKIVESLDPVCDREALRVLSMMPHWKAGIQNDKPCRTMVCIPIVFRL
jgi:protein TonB